MIDIQFIGRADERVRNLYEYAVGGFSDLIKRQAWVFGAVAMEYGQAIGWACFSINNPAIIDLGQRPIAQTQQPLLIGAYVYPEQRKRGLGSALVKEAVRYYGFIEHMPEASQQEFLKAMQLPCLYDPAILSLIRDVKHIQFEAIPEEEECSA